MCCTLLENFTGETARHFSLGSRRRSLQAVRTEETMSGLPEPGPGSSCVGDPGRVNTAEAIRDQSWEQKTGQQGPAVQMNQESVQRRPGPQLGVA